MSVAIKGHRYQHFKSKGFIYTVLEADAVSTENVQRLVVYRSEYSKPDYPKGTVWVRPKEEFESKKILPDGTEVERFLDIGE